MSEKSLANRGRALEDEYFRKQDRELIEKLRRRSESEAEQQEMAASVGITDPQIMRSLVELGHTRETIPLLYLMPMVQVAWSDGSISKRERGLILEVAASHGLQADSPAHQQLRDWLDEKPSEEFLMKTLCLMAVILDSLPPDKQQISRRDLASYCTQVAEAQGSLLGRIGIGSNISTEERTLLDRVAAELEHHHEIAARRLIET